MRCDTADSVEGGTHAGRLQCPASRCLDMADPLLWNRSREPNSGSSRGLRNRPLPCPRYQVTRAQLRSGGQQVRDGAATESGPQVCGQWKSRADGQVRVAGLPIVVCAALASGLLLCLSKQVPHAGRRKERAAQRCCRWRGATSRRPMDVAKVPGAAADQPGSSGRTV
jgi:hypothetical protein